MSDGLSWAYEQKKQKEEYNKHLESGAFSKDYLEADIVRLLTKDEIHMLATRLIIHQLGGFAKFANSSICSGAEKLANSEVKSTDSDANQEKMVKCPKCNSNAWLTERRPNGDSQCSVCGYRAKTALFTKLTVLPVLGNAQQTVPEIEDESPYCQACGGCGEDGCCDARRCLYPGIKKETLDSMHEYIKTLEAKLAKEVVSPKSAEFPGTVTIACQHLADLEMRIAELESILRYLLFDAIECPEAETPQFCASSFILDKARSALGTK